MAVRMIVRSGTAEEWRVANPVLQLSEVGAETDTRRMKLGDGMHPWNLLGYVDGKKAQDDLPEWGSPDRALTPEEVVTWNPHPPAIIYEVPPMKTPTVGVEKVEITKREKFLSWMAKAIRGE
jgi:hypothetical protein